MKIGDLVRRKKNDGISSTIPDEEVAIVMEIKELKKYFVDNEGRPMPKANLITVVFPETNITHRFPEYYLELISEA